MAITRSKQKLENQKRKEADDALGYDGVYHHYLFKLQEILNIQFFQKLNFVLLLRSFFRFEWLNTLVIAPLLAIFKYCLPFLFVDPHKDESDAEDAHQALPMFDYDHIKDMSPTPGIAVLQNSDALWHKLFVAQLQALGQQGFSKYDAELYRLAADAGMANLQQWLSNGIISQDQFEDLSSKYLDECHNCREFCEREQRHCVNFSDMLQTMKQTQKTLTKHDLVKNALGRLQAQETRTRSELFGDLLRDVKTRVSIDRIIPNAETARGHAINRHSNPLSLKRKEQQDIAMLEQSESGFHVKFTEGAHYGTGKNTHNRDYSRLLAPLANHLGADVRSEIFHDKKDTSASYNPETQHGFDEVAKSVIHVAQGHRALTWVFKPIILPLVHEWTKVLSNRLMRLKQVFTSMPGALDANAVVNMNTPQPAQCPVHAEDAGRLGNQHVISQLPSKTLTPAAPSLAEKTCPALTQTPNHALFPGVRPEKNQGFLKRIFSLWANANQIIMARQPHHLPVLPYRHYDSSVMQTPQYIKPLGSQQLLSPPLALPRDFQPVSEAGRRRYASPTKHAPVCYANETRAVGKHSEMTSSMRASDAVTGLSELSMFSRRLRPRFGSRVSPDKRFVSDEPKNKVAAAAGA